MASENPDTQKSNYAETLITKALDSQESFDATVEEINSRKGPEYLVGLLSFTKQKIMDDLMKLGNVVTPIYEGVTIYVNGNFEKGITNAYKMIDKAFEQQVRGLG